MRREICSEICMEKCNRGMSIGINDDNMREKSNIRMDDIRVWGVKNMRVNKWRSEKGKKRIEKGIEKVEGEEVRLNSKWMGVEKVEEGRGGGNRRLKWLEGLEWGIVKINMVFCGIEDDKSENNRWVVMEEEERKLKSEMVVIVKIEKKGIVEEEERVLEREDDILVWGIIEVEWKIGDNNGGKNIWLDGEWNGKFKRGIERIVDELWGEFGIGDLRRDFEKEKKIKNERWIVKIGKDLKMLVKIEGIGKGKEMGMVLDEDKDEEEVELSKNIEKIKRRIGIVEVCKEKDVLDIWSMERMKKIGRESNKKNRKVGI